MFATASVSVTRKARHSHHVDFKMLTQCARCACYSEIGCIDILSAPLCSTDTIPISNVDLMRALGTPLLASPSWSTATAMLHRPSAKSVSGFRYELHAEV